MKTSAAAAVSLSMAGHSRSVMGANDRIRMGFIGVGNRGSQLLEAFMGNPDVEIAALCDVYEPYLKRDRSHVDPKWLEMGSRIPRMGEVFPENPALYKDFRKLIGDKSLDAVCIATPDHWHAVQTIMAMDAGKDVYVEKPLTITLVEGRKMVEAQKRFGRVVQVGLHRRGSASYQNLAGVIQGGRIGKIVTARAYRISNMYPNGIGRMKPEDPPGGFDWDMWLGPRPYRPYQYNIAPYSFRWWHLYSTQMGNWGVHYMDTIRWMMGESAPVAVTAVGNNHFLKDDRTIPSTMEVTFEMKTGAMIQFHIHEACGGSGVAGGEIELCGSKGSVISNERGYQIQPSGAGQFQTWERLVEPDEYAFKEDGNMKMDPTANQVRNFLDCVKSRKEPWCPLEEGHRSTSFAHLANIALEMKKRLEWDAENERFTNYPEANELLHYEYRKPWRLD